MRLEGPRRRAFGLTAVVLVAIAAGLVLQPPGCNQTAHLALVKSIVGGTPRIDRFEAQTCDDAFIDGHYYAAKAPGLALFTAPWYGLLRLAHVAASDDTLHLSWPTAMVEMKREAVWQLSLWGATLPLLGLLLLLRWSVGRLVPGYGTITAVTAGLATLLFPFGTLFFAHLLSATLGFAAWCVLLRERDGPGPRRVLVVAGGSLAGLAVVVEFPLALVAICLGAYAATRRDTVRRLAAYGAGVLVGVAPLLAFDAWAFGSPFRLSYSNAVIDPGASGHDVVGANDRGLFGVGAPSPRALLELIASGKGLLVLTPITAAGAVGLVALYRAGRRPEALLAGAVVGLFLAYNASYYLPFGGWVPGPRFLVPALPFLAIGIAAAYRACWPATIALATISAGWMVTATVAEPLLEGDDAFSWLHRIRDGDLSATLVTTLGGGRSFAGAIPVIACVAVSIALAVALLPRPRPTPQAWRLTVVAIAGWLLVAAVTPDLLRLDAASGGAAGALAVSFVIASVALACRAAWRADRRQLVAVAPLLLLATPIFSDHSKWSLGLAVIVFVALATITATQAKHRSTPA